MNIWIIDHYSVPIKYYPLARNTNFAKYLKTEGHKVTIFAASSVHNSDVNLVKKNREYINIIDNDVNYVLIKCHQYTGNGVNRVLNMYEFARKLEKVCAHYEKPDVIISTSMTLFACKKGIELAQKYKCKKIAQITDLWPETLIAYGKAGKYHPLVLFFRRIEKWIYMHADSIIFSMEGAYDYIKEQGWDKEIPRSKVYFINNGVDLKQFDYNCSTFSIKDNDLDNEDIIRIVYTGSIRKVNNLGKLLDVAKLVTNPKVKFLIWGDGDELSDLVKRVDREKITNVVFKGKVDKKYIPFITSKADINIAHNGTSPLFRFGISFNKIFDYLAAGKTILCDFYSKYNPVIRMKAGFSVDSGENLEIAKAIDEIVISERMNEYGLNDRKAAYIYSFDNLTKKLVDVIQKTFGGNNK